MAISTCSKCKKLYDFWSEEDANAPDRLCLDCHNKKKSADSYEEGWEDMESNPN